MALVVIVAGGRVLLPAFRQAVEVLEEVELWDAILSAVLCLPAKVFDDRARLNLLLDVDRWGVDLERVGLEILAAPNQLRIKIGIALPPQLLDRLVFVGDELLVLRSRYFSA